MSMGADTKANAWEPVRSPGGLLQRAQRRVPLQALRESGFSFGTEIVCRDTARTGTEVGAEWCQWALTQNQTLRGGGALEVGDLRLVEDGSQRSGALGSDVVASETASTWDGVSTGADTKANATAMGARLR